MHLIRFYLNFKDDHDFFNFLNVIFESDHLQKSILFCQKPCYKNVVIQWKLPILKTGRYLKYFQNGLAFRARIGNASLSEFPEIYSDVIINWRFYLCDTFTFVTLFLDLVVPSRWPNAWARLPSTTSTTRAATTTTSASRRNPKSGKSNLSAKTEDNSGRRSRSSGNAAGERGRCGNDEGNTNPELKIYFSNKIL